MPRRRGSEIIKVRNVTHFYRNNDVAAGNVGALIRNYEGECASMDFIGGSIWKAIIAQDFEDAVDPAGVTAVVGDHFFKYCNMKTDGWPALGNLDLQHNNAWLQDYPAYDSDVAWTGRSVLRSVVPGAFPINPLAARIPVVHEWYDIGNGIYGYEQNGTGYTSRTRVLRGIGAQTHREVKPVVCHPGDYLFIQIDHVDTDTAGERSMDYPEYELATGSLNPLVRIGAARCGNVDGGNYGRTTGNLKVYDSFGIVVRVPLGAKTGPLRIWGRKGSTTWLGSKTNARTGALIRAAQTSDDVPIPVIVMNEAQPICEEAYQMGRTNASTLESMINPSGATQNAGDTVQIGSNCFMGSANCSKSAYSRAGTGWPIGFTNPQYHFLNYYGKEMTFRLTMSASGGSYGPAIASMILFAGASVLAGGFGVPLLFAAGFISVYGGLILHEMGKASGGGAFFRLHRSHISAGENYGGQGREDISQARDTQHGEVTFSKMMSTSTGTVGTHIFMDLSRARHIADNDLHDSVARTNKTIAVGGIAKSSALLNCQGAISVLKADGSEDRKMVVGYEQSMNAAQKTLGISAEPVGGLYVGRGGVGNPPNANQTDWDDWWGDKSVLMKGPGKSNECFWDKGDGLWYANGVPFMYQAANDAFPGAKVPGFAFPLLAGGFHSRNEFTYGPPMTDWAYPWQKAAAGQAHEWPTVAGMKHTPVVIPGIGTPGGLNAGGARFFGGMTPLTSPPSMRNVTYEALVQDSHARMGDDHDHFCLTRSEGLGFGGGLWFPRWYGQAIGKGHMTVVSSRLYDENGRCLKCAATAWGHDARYCMRNPSALGYGGWFFGQKSKPSFFIAGKPLRMGIGNFGIDQILNIQPNRGSVGGPQISRYFKQEDINMHDQSKWIAGLHFGGWPQNILAGAGAYERQPGGSCFVEPVNVDIAVDPNHPNVGTPVGQVNPNKYNVHGHGWDFWDAGCIPTFAKNEVSAWDIYHGNINKYDNMRNAAKFSLTERNDLIHIIGTMSFSADRLPPAQGAWEAFDYSKIQPVGPQHEFRSGDIVVLRITPNTTKTADPGTAVRLRKLHDDQFSMFGGGGQAPWCDGTMGRPSPINMHQWETLQVGEVHVPPDPALVAAGAKDIGGCPLAGGDGGTLGCKMQEDQQGRNAIWDWYTIGNSAFGGGIGANKKGPATLILEANRTLDNWVQHVGDDGGLGKASQTLVDFWNMDNTKKGAAVRSRALKAMIGAAQGKPICDELNITDDSYIDGWNFMLKAQARLRGRDTYMPTFFHNLRRVTFGRNGPECRFRLNNTQAGGDWTRLIAGAGAATNAGLYDQNYIDLLKAGALAKAKKALQQHINYVGCAACTPVIPPHPANVPGVNPLHLAEGSVEERKRRRALQDKIDNIELKIRVAENYMRFASAALPAGGGGMNTHLFEQQVAIKLPDTIQSGGGISRGPTDGDTDRLLTTDYLWFYFEELYHSRTEGVPVTDTPAAVLAASLLTPPELAPIAKQRAGRGGLGGQPSSSYIGIMVPVNIFNQNKAKWDNCNTLSLGWESPPNAYTDALFAERGDGLPMP